MMASVTPAIHAFADEYGDSNLAVEKTGVTSFFIITVILVEDAQVAPLRTQVDDIRKRFFGQGEIKSSGIGSDDERRLRILKEVAALPYHSYSLAVDKSELDRESGLAYKRSFFKYLHKRLYERIYKLFNNVTVIADEHGSEAFMKGFKSYLDRELRPDLFCRREFSFQDSKSEPLLQLADLVSGSMARAVDPKKVSSRSKEVLDIVSKCSLGIEFWPPIWAADSLALVVDSEQVKHDDLVRSYCLKQARIFLQQHACSNDVSEDVRVQLEILQYLLFHVLFVDSAEFIHGAAIAKWLVDNVGVETTYYQVRFQVAHLRDAGVLISSGPKGYKIPVSVADMTAFALHAKTMIPPMLARLGRARSDLHVASLGKLDILQHNDFEVLNRLLDVVKRDKR